jgi:hypothetical protein
VTMESDQTISRRRSTRRRQLSCWSYCLTEECFRGVSYCWRIVSPMRERGIRLVVRGNVVRPLNYSNAKIWFQSLFMLMTVQPFLFASS